MNEQLDQSDVREAVQTRPAPSSARRPYAGSRPVRAPHTPPPEDEEDSFFERHRTKFIIGVVVLLVGVAAFFVKPGKSSSPSRPPERMVSIQLPPPLPPPPPPPKVQPPPPKEQKMVEQPPEAAPEKPAEQVKPKEEAPAQTLGTGIKGDGAGMAGLGSSGSGGGFGGAKSGSGGSKWGWYTGQVQSRVADALRRNKTTKSANLQIQVRIWADSTGHIQRAKVEGTSGDRAVDTALQNEVLTGLQLEPPPQGMPMPIVMRLTARRP